MMSQIGQLVMLIARSDTLKPFKIEGLHVYTGHVYTGHYRYLKFKKQKIIIEILMTQCPGNPNFCINMFNMSLVLEMRMSEVFKKIASHKIMKFVNFKNGGNDVQWITLHALRKFFKKFSLFFDEGFAYLEV